MQEQTTVVLAKDAWESPIKEDDGYAPNAADCTYHTDRKFRRWLRWTINYLMYGWAEELHDKPGFLRFCMWAQLQFLDHMKGLALTVADKGFHEILKDFHEDENRVEQEYEDTNNSSIEWGDERGQTDDCPHLMFCLRSEFRQRDYPEDQWFELMTSFGEQQCDDTAVWFAPERGDFRDLRAVGRYMLKEVKAAEKELKEFWAEYGKQYPLSDEPEEWRG